MKYIRKDGGAYSNEEMEYSTFPIKWEALQMGSSCLFGLLFFSRTNGISNKWEEISRILTKTRKFCFKTSLKFIVIFSRRNGISNKWEEIQNSLLKKYGNGIPVDRECTVVLWQETSGILTANRVPHISRYSDQLSRPFMVPDPDWNGPRGYKEAHDIVPAEGRLSEMFTAIGISSCH